MLRKVSVPVSLQPYPSIFLLNTLQITGLVLNQSHYLCSDCATPKPQYLFGMVFILCDVYID